MAVELYNTLTKRKEALPLIEGKVIRMYSCGVTVYDKCHIGHARSLYVFDVIRRYLKYRDYDLRFVRNITDIDDKIINKAKELGVDSKEVAEKNIEDYYHDLERLGIDKADIEPKATDNIELMIEMIRGLIEKGSAYEVDGDVYFSVREFKDYGKLSGQSIDQMREAVRIDKDEKKKDPLDFALWKKSKEGEPSWSSPWGEGRPGWHIECSCMSLTHLDCETLDIHAGGRDLVFPHHENEIAQAESFTGKPFAKSWMHHGLLTINKQKMAKSLGNFITIEDAVEKYGANELKMFFLSSHYRSHIDFSEEAMEEAKKNIARLVRVMKRLKENLDSLDENERKELEKEKQKGGVRALDKFKEGMDDDFNTPKALATFNYLIKESDAVMKSNVRHKGWFWETLYYNFDALNKIVELFGLKLDLEDDQITDEVESLINERKEARKNKDFKRSDELRDLLKAKGIVVEDTPKGQEWRRA